MSANISLCARVARSVDRSIDRSVARSLDRSVARSLDRSVARSLARSVTRSLDRSIARSLGRSAARSFARSLHRLTERSKILPSRYLRLISVPCPLPASKKGTHSILEDLRTWLVCIGGWRWERGMSEGWKTLRTLDIGPTWIEHECELMI